MPASPFEDDGQTMEPSVSVTDPDGAQVGRYARAGSGAGTAGITVEGVGILGEAAAAAPSAGGMAGPNIRPLAHLSCRG